MKIAKETPNVNFAELKISAGSEIKEANKSQVGEAAPLKDASVSAAVKLIESKGYQLDDKALAELENFMLNGEGDVESKLEAIDTALSKDMPLKEAILSRLQLVSRKSLVDFLPEIEPMKNMGKREAVGSAKVYKKGVLSKTNVRATISTSENTLSEHGLIEAKTAHKPELTPLDKLDELLKNLVREVDNLRKSEVKSYAAEYVKDEAEPQTVSKEDADTKPLMSEEKLFSDDLELLASYISGISGSEFMGAAPKSLPVLMTEITPKLSALKAEFEDMKKGLAKNMDKLSFSDKPLKREDALRTLENAIDKLDRSIMKSEMSLYMDMKGERELVKISSELAAARDMLTRGEVGEVKLKLVEVLETLKKLDYVPSIRKAVLIYASDEAADFKSMKQLYSWLDKRADDFKIAEASPQHVINYLRKMGYNAESEQFDRMCLFKQHNEDIRDFNNLKTMLKHISESASRYVDKEEAKTMMGRLEGAELRNKLLDTREPQSVVFELPLKLNGAVKNVKIYIKAAQKDMKLDWENFNMFFVLTTERLGELGIKVEALQKKLSVSIMNDKAKSLEYDYDFKSPFKKEIEELGFMLVNMILKEWNDTVTQDKKAVSGSKPIAPKSLEEGRFDMSV